MYATEWLAQMVNMKELPMNEVSEYTLTSLI